MSSNSVSYPKCTSSFTFTHERRFLMRIVDARGKFSLRNEGALEVFFIGVGSAFALKHFQTNVILVKGNTHIAVDFGMTAPRALKETAGLEVTDLETVLPTHSHADHVGGIECVGLMSRYFGIPRLGKKKPVFIINEEYQEILWDRTLRGGMEWNEEEQTSQSLLGFCDYFDVVRPQWLKHQPREILSVNYGGIEIEMFRTMHIPDSARGWQDSFVSFGLWVDRRVFISVDTRFDRDLIDLYAHRSEVMFHDVQFFPGAVHAPLADLKTLPEDIKRKMHLMHYSDDWERQDISGFAGWTLQGHRYIFD